MYPNATKATTNTFFLGTSPVVRDEHIDYIEVILDKFFESRKA
jgi:dTDP-4-amino-4,6-dideoxygalactose transaminase